MLRFSLDAMTGFSYVPLQLATTAWLSARRPEPGGHRGRGRCCACSITRSTGQASTLILVLFLGGIQLIFLGIIGEYLGRIYDEVRARPLYIVRETIGRGPATGLALADEGH